MLYLTDREHQLAAVRAAELRRHVAANHVAGQLGVRTYTAKFETGRVHGPLTRSAAITRTAEVLREQLGVSWETACTDAELLMRLIEAH